MSEPRPGRKFRLMPVLSATDVVMAAHGALMMAWLFAVMMTWTDEAGDPSASVGTVFLAWAAGVPLAWLAGVLVERQRARRIASVPRAGDGTDGEGGVAAAA